MGAAWSDSVDYILGDTVTHGGHTYEWSSADPDVAVEPPGGSWIRLDPDQSGASVADSRLSAYTTAAAPLDSDVNFAFVLDAGAGSDISIDPDDPTIIHLAGSATYLIQVSATVNGGTVSNARLSFPFVSGSTEGYDGAPYSGYVWTTHPRLVAWMRITEDSAIRVACSPDVSDVDSTVGAGIDILRVA